MSPKLPLGLLIVSFLASLNVFYGNWMRYAWPFILLAIVLLWFSKTKLWVKIVASIAPFLLWYPCFLMIVLIAPKNMSKEEFNIPKDFRGEIVLVYDEPCGQTLPEENSCLVYNIPKHGIMILKNRFEIGMLNQTYSFVDDNWNTLGPIQTLYLNDFTSSFAKEKTKAERSEVGVFLIGSGEGSYENGKNYKFHKLNVNSYDSLSVQMERNNKVQEDLLEKMLKNCRELK